MQLNPSLFVGLGGTGYLTLSRIKQHLQKFFDNDIPNAIDFLVVDIDKGLPPEMTSADPIFDENAGEIWNPVLPRVDEIDSQVEQGLKPFFVDWWPKNLDKVFKAQDMSIEEAYQHRCLGRAAMLWYGTFFEQMIREKYNRITGPDARYVNDKSITVTRTPMMFLVSSVAGGTGSGMFLDVAAILRSISRVCKIHGVLFLPSMFREVLHNAASDWQKAYANTYGSLKEFDYFMSGNTFSMHYDQLLNIKVVNGRLMNMVYLVDNHKEEEGTEETVGDRSLVADAVSEFLLGLATGVNWGGGGGIHQRVGAHYQIPGGSKVTRAYSSFGKSSIEFPKNDLIELAQNNMTSFLCDKMQGGNNKHAEITNILDGNPGSGTRKLWDPSGTGPIMPIIMFDLVFGKANLESYKSTDKAKLANKVIKQYQSERNALIKKHGELLKKLTNYPPKEIKSIIENKVRDLFGNEIAGLPATLNFCNELKERISICQKSHNALSGDVKSIFYDQKKMTDIENTYDSFFKSWFKRWEKRKTRLRELIGQLKRDLITAELIIRDDLINLSCQKLLDYIDSDLMVKLRNLHNLFEKQKKEALNRTTELREEFQRRALSEIMVGVDPYIIDPGGTLDCELLNYVAEAGNSLRDEVKESMQCTDSIIAIIAQNAVERTIFTKQSIIDQLGNGEELSRHLGELRSQAIPMWPLDVTKHVDARNRIFRMLSAFNESEITNRGGNVPNGVQWVTTDILKNPNRIVCLCLNAGVPFHYLSIADECYQMYNEVDVSKTGNERWQTTVTPNAATYPDIVMTTMVGEMDVDKLFETVEFLKFISKTPKGTRYKVLIGYDQRGGEKVKTFPSKKKIKETMKSDVTFTRNLQEVVIRYFTTLGSTASRQWLFDNPDLLPQNIRRNVISRLEIEI